jgi:catechol 2,3-dioxygenase-like lactoylglutathione lyase family enzyme
MSDTNKPRLVGINHIAIEVSDIDQALDFYGKIFDFKLRAKRPGNAFIELGDQFINMMQTVDPHEDRRRHFGLVVDDRSSVRARVEAAGGKLLPRLSRPLGESRRGGRIRQYSVHQGAASIARDGLRSR